VGPGRTVKGCNGSRAAPSRGQEERGGRPIRGQQACRSGTYFEFCGGKQVKWGSGGKGFSRKKKRSHGEES